VTPIKVSRLGHNLEVIYLLDVKTGSYQCWKRGRLGNFETWLVKKNTKLN
jgi:hypothetical protein